VPNLRHPIRRVIAVCAGLAAPLVLIAACSPGQYPVDYFREMHYQQSHRLLQADRLAPPPDAVPITGSRASLSFAQAGAMQSPVAPSPQRLEQGQTIFRVNCAMCHGADGRGTGMIADRFAAGSASPPVDFTSARARGRTDGELFWIVTNGLGNMPPFGDLLTDDQRWTVIQAIRGIQGQ
jgi:mono/diheme cytochrome c family protein